MFFKPTWDHGFGIETNKVRIKSIIDLITLEGIRLNLENYFFNFPKPWPLSDEVAFSSYLILPFFYFLFFIFHVKGLFYSKEFIMNPSLLFSLGTVIYLILVSNLVELAENNRYRVMIDPLVFSMLAPKFISFIKEKLGRT